VRNFLHDHVDPGVFAPDAVRPDLDVPHAPVHQPAWRMEVRSVGELALDRLDRVHQLVALADADDLPARLGHADVGERIDEFAIRPLAVERDAGEQSGLFTSGQRGAFSAMR
jgi:hypothetical protein